MSADSRKPRPPLVPAVPDLDPRRPLAGGAPPAPSLEASVERALQALVRLVAERAVRPGRHSAGVRALLLGTDRRSRAMVANSAAERLGANLVRIQVPERSGRYIGETEKNLAAHLARAADAGAVLLFDEADALFGRRTSVRDSHDRHATAESTALLDRIMAYAGVALVACEGDAGPAAAARFDLVIEIGEG